MRQKSMSGMRYAWASLKLRAKLVSTSSTAEKNAANSASRPRIWTSTTADSDSPSAAADARDLERQGHRAEVDQRRHQGDRHDGDVLRQQDAQARDGGGDEDLQRRALALAGRQVDGGVDRAGHRHEDEDQRHEHRQRGDDFFGRSSITSAACTRTGSPRWAMPHAGAGRSVDHRRVRLRRQPLQVGDRLPAARRAVEVRQRASTCRGRLRVGTNRPRRRQPDRRHRPPPGGAPRPGRPRTEQPVPARIEVGGHGRVRRLLAVGPAPCRAARFCRPDLPVVAATAPPPRTTKPTR